MDCDKKRKKIIVVGDSTVGKTSLVWRAANIDKSFPLKFEQTTMRTEVLQQIGDKCDDITELMIWDTAGQVDYDRLRTLAYKGGADIVLILCSRSSLTSLLNLKFQWIPEIDEFLPGVKKVLVVNKMDLEKPDEMEDFVTDELIEEAYKNYHFKLLCKVSALTGENVKNLLEDVVKLANAKQTKKGM